MLGGLSLVMMNHKWAFAGPVTPISIVAKTEKKHRLASRISILRRQLEFLCVKHATGGPLDQAFYGVGARVPNGYVSHVGFVTNTGLSAPLPRFFCADWSQSLI